MNIKENAKNHFRGLRSGELSIIEVPEWSNETEIAKIYYKPSMSLKERDRISKEYEKNGTMSGIAMTLIVRALDESGKALYRPMEKLDIMNENDSDVILRIVEEMNANEIDNVEDAGKN